mgnify:FL=1|jgi:hypothetical protein|tara:strand:+ start:196 stop:309 length:114 start_codon:yes stop_codon:yes gene_type:complete
MASENREEGELEQKSQDSGKVTLTGRELIILIIFAPV